MPSSLARPPRLHSRQARPDVRPLLTYIRGGGSTAARRPAWQQRANDRPVQPQEAVRTSIAASAAAYGQEGQPAQGTPQPPLMTAPALVQDILRLSLPLTLTNASGMSLNCLSDAMVGRLGAAALGTSTLANSFYGMMGVSVVWGGAAGMETLVGQAWGAGDLRVVRVVLLRALLVCWALSSVIVVLWQQALPLMLALGQNPGMAAAGARYLQALGPSLFVYVLAECLQSFLVATGNVRPTTLAKGVTAVLGPPLYFLLMFKCGLGLEGAAYAYACCKLVNALLLVGWIAWRGDALLQPPQPHPHSPSQPAASSSSSSSIITTYLDKAGGEKGGSSSSGQAELRQRLLPPLAESGPEAAAAVDHMPQAVKGGLLSGLGGWGEVADARGCWQYIKYGAPSAAMTLLEWWAYEANVLMAGTLATADVVVAVLGIGLAVSGWAYTFPQSLASATCTRVANALGAGQAALAQAYFRTGMMLVLLQQLMLAALIATFSHHIVAFFCSDAAVMHIARGVVPILALNIVFDGVNVVLNGVLRACGRQALGARLQLCSYWLLGVPLAYFLGIKLGLGPKGFVAASGLASLTQALLCSTIFARLDWEAEVQRSKSMLQDMSATMQPVAPALHASPALNVAT